MSFLLPWDVFCSPLLLLTGNQSFFVLEVSFSGGGCNAVCVGVSAPVVRVAAVTRNSLDVPALSGFGTTRGWGGGGSW